MEFTKKKPPNKLYAIIFIISIARLVIFYGLDL